LKKCTLKGKLDGFVAFMTSGQETEWVYSYNPGVRQLAIKYLAINLVAAFTVIGQTAWNLLEANLRQIATLLFKRQFKLTTLVLFLTIPSFISCFIIDVRNMF